MGNCRLIHSPARCLRARNICLPLKDKGGLSEDPSTDKEPRICTQDGESHPE
jgi:hypothetical protein